MRRLLSMMLFIVVLLNGVFYLQQPAMTFYPVRDVQASPLQWGLPYEEVTLRTEDGLQLHGWFLPAPKATRTLLFFHGNGGNISHRGESLAIFHRLGLNVLIFDYRGYGNSEGEPGEEGLYRDAAAAWRYLTEQRGVAAGQIIIFGRSLGGAVAAQLATQVKPAALILESTFTSARAMATELFPLLSRVLLLRYDFNTLQRIAAIPCPLYLAHSREDEIIPYRFGQQLYAATPQPKRFFTMRGGHNGGFLRSQPDYEAGLKAFLESVPVAAKS